VTALPKPAEPARLLSPKFLLATAGNLGFFIGLTTFFSLPVHLEDLGASRVEVGRVMGVFGATSMLAIPATGVLVDRIGRRPFMLLGASLWAVVALVFTQVDRIGPLVYVLRLGQGLAFALTFVATNALVADLAPPRALGRAIAVFGTTTLATHAIGPTLGELIAGTYGFPVLYAASGASACLAVVAFSFIGESAPERADPRAGEAEVGLVSLVARPGARSALFGAFTSALSFGAAMNFMPIFVRSRGLPSYSPFFASYVVAAVVVRLGAGGLGDRFGHRRIGAGALFLFSMVVAMLSRVDSTAMLVSLAFVFGATHGLVYPSLNALFLDGAPSSARGRAMAGFTLAFNVGMTTAAFAGGEIAERAGYASMWLFVGTLAVVGAISVAVDRPQQVTA
jgi:MFS family permease